MQLIDSQVAIDAEERSAQQQRSSENFRAAWQHISSIGSHFGPSRGVPNHGISVASFGSACREGNHAASEKPCIERVSARSQECDRRRVYAGKDNVASVGVGEQKKTGEFKQAGEDGHNRRKDSNTQKQA